MSILAQYLVNALIILSCRLHNFVRLFMLCLLLWTSLKLTTGEEAPKLHLQVSFPKPNDQGVWCL